MQTYSKHARELLVDATAGEAVGSQFLEMRGKKDTLSTNSRVIHNDWEKKYCGWNLNWNSALL